MSKKMQAFLSFVVAGALGCLIAAAFAIHGGAANVEASTVADAASIFNAKCASCHGKDGRSKTMKSKLRYHARDLTDANWQNEVSDERLFNSISNGKGKMPAFKKKLSDSDIDALVSYVRRLKK